MRYAQVRKLEKDIQNLDASTLVKRWRYGRRLLEDDAATTPAGNLRNGVLKMLITGAKRDGLKLCEREIQMRVQFARTYPTAAHVHEVLARFGNFSQVRDAGFPEIEVPAGAGAAEDDLAAAEDAAGETARQDGAAQLLSGTHKESPLFPPRFSEFSSLTDLAKYSAEMAELTERFAVRDRERTAYLARLIAAVDGDMGATWEEAHAALGDEGL